jgi:hypothetical protein
VRSSYLKYNGVAVLIRALWPVEFSGLHKVCRCLDAACIDWMYNRPDGSPSDCST